MENSILSLQQIDEQGGYSDQTSCPYLAQVATPEMINQLEMAAALAHRSGHPKLAKSLRDWKAHLVHALAASKECAVMSELWLG